MLEPTTITIFGLVLIVLLLVATIGMQRLIIASTSDKAPNSFLPTGKDVGGFAVRLARAHANCYEFLPFALAVLVYAAATGSSALTNGLAYYFLIARIGQSATHLISTSTTAVFVRFAFFLAQVVILLVWCLRFLGVL
jgi:uncharacterized MAPEG superfamily protein